VYASTRVRYSDGRKNRSDSKLRLLHSRTCSLSPTSNARLLMATIARNKAFLLGNKLHAKGKKCAFRLSRGVNDARYGGRSSGGDGSGVYR
jgi:hypothetical protein